MIEEIPKLNLHQGVLVRELNVTGTVYERPTADNGETIYGIKLDEIAFPKNFVPTRVWHCPLEGLKVNDGD